VLHYSNDMLFIHVINSGIGHIRKFAHVSSAWCYRIADFDLRHSGCEEIRFLVYGLGYHQMKINKRKILIPGHQLSYVLNCIIKLLHECRISQLINELDKEYVMRLTNRINNYYELERRDPCVIL
jgi:hypothetical protein